MLFRSGPDLIRHFGTRRIPTLDVRRGPREIAHVPGRELVREPAVHPLGSDGSCASRRRIRNRDEGVGRRGGLELIQRDGGEHITDTGDDRRDEQGGVGRGDPARVLPRGRTESRE